MTDQRWTVQRILDWTTDYLKKHGSETPRLDSEVLLAHARGCSRIELYTRFDEELTESERAVMRDLVRRRAAQEPVAYLVGRREFYGLEFRVDRNVLIPRPETETLVLELLDLAKPMPAPKILDVGTGSGCIAIATAVNHPGAVLTATETAEAALNVARDNAQRHNVADRIRFLHGDLLAPLPDGETFDFIVSNPPYVSEDEIERLSPTIRKHEPLSALAAGPDGLDVIRRLISEAPRRLSPGGRLLVEISPEQAQPARDLLTDSQAYDEIDVRGDLSGRPRVVRARRDR